MSVSNAAATGFTLRLPDSWIELDVWRATRTGDLARWADARLADRPELAAWRAPLLKLLRDVAGRADRDGALYCAVMTDPIEDAGTLAASVMVFRTDGAADPADNTVEAIAGQITAVAPSDGATTPWRTAGVVELPAGRAVRVRAVEAVDVDGVAIDCVMLQTLVPVPDGGGVLAVVCTSPQVELAEPLLDLFEAISDTLAWSREPVRPE